MEDALKLTRQLSAARAAQRSLKSLQLSANTTVSCISEGVDIQQAVRRSVQEALKDYFPMQSSDSPAQSADADVQTVTSQRFNPDSVSQTGNQYPQGRLNHGRGGSNRSLTCWNCGEPGHIRARYLKPRRDGSNCTCCGERGHSQEKYPTWQRERDERNSIRATNATISSRIAKHDDGIFIHLQIAGEKIKFLVGGGGYSFIAAVLLRSVAIVRYFLEKFCGLQLQTCLAKPSQHVCQARDMLLECTREDHNVV